MPKSLLAKPHRFQLALRDILNSFHLWPIWVLLAWQDIKLRYRRSTLGPFWLTISMAVTIYTMGFLYGRLFGVDLSTYYPYLAAGMITWQFFSALLTESTQAFIQSDAYLKEVKIPAPTFMLRLILRNLIIFLHNIPVIIPLIFIFHVPVNIYTLFIFVGLFLICLNGYFFGLLLAIFGTRFRDFAQIINSLVQVIFFMTPIMWQATLISAKNQWIVSINPFAQFVALIRDPLLGTMPSSYTLTYVALFTLAGIVLCIPLFSRYRNRIVYWL